VTPHHAPGPGDPAPDFVLRDQHGATVSLRSFHGRRDVVLVFFPFAFSSVCTGELHVLRDHLDRFETADAAVLGVSCDAMYSLRVFADRDHLGFSLLSDFWPHGAVAASYGVLDGDRGSPRRSTFVIDREGTVRGSVHHELAEPRQVADYLATLAEIADSRAAK